MLRIKEDKSESSNRETKKAEDICKMAKKKKQKKTTKVGVRVRPAVLVALKTNDGRKSTV